MTAQEYRKRAALYGSLDARLTAYATRVSPGYSRAAWSNFFAYEGRGNRARRRLEANRTSRLNSGDRY